MIVGPSIPTPVANLLAIGGLLGCVVEIHGSSFG